MSCGDKTYSCEYELADLKANGGRAEIQATAEATEKANEKVDAIQPNATETGKKQPDLSSAVFRNCSLT